jgi:Copper transport outer membrane protein, MctB
VINFRYHVVSIVAVFLALSIGIVLGSTELRGKALDTLAKASNNLAGDLSAARTQNRTLQQEVSADQGFAQADEARLLDGLLTDQRVVLVAAPGAPGSVINGVAAALHQAGATVTGQLDLQPKLLDASESNQQYLSTLVNGLVTPGSSAANGTPLQQAAQLLGSAILTKNDPSSGGTDQSSTASKTVLSSYGTAGLVSVASGEPSVPATLAVVITPASPPVGGDSDPANQGLITLAQELDSAGLGTVMAGPASGSVAGSAINALRASSAAAQISSVDDADSVFGQIVTVQALQLALTGHKPGDYGEDPGAGTAGPSPAPTPSTSSPSTQVTNAKTHHAGRTDSPGKKSSKGKA